MSLELRRQEFEDGWEGYLLEEGAWFHVDTRLEKGDWRRKIRVGKRAVLEAIGLDELTETAEGVPA